MVTSRSNRESGKWIAGALIFSGRPDPTWTVKKRVVERLEKLWASLELSSEEIPAAPVLGYRGCFLKDDRNREWFAYGGIVTLHVGSHSESREDKERVFEKTLLASAPKGTVPSTLMRNNPMNG